MSENEKYYNFEPVKLEVRDMESEGYILDIGGGGEGVIGRLKGKDVIAIDIRKEELEEAVDGPLKIIMDAEIPMERSYRGFLQTLCHGFLHEG